MSNSSRQPSNTPQEDTPLKYVDPQDPEDGYPDNGPEDPEGPNKPEGPNNPDRDPDPEDPEEPEPQDQFLNALHDLADSLQTLRQPQAAHPKKVKVQEPDTFNRSNPQKLQDFLVSCNLHFCDHSNPKPNNPPRHSLLLLALPLHPVLTLDQRALQRTSQKTPSWTSWGRMVNSPEKRRNAK